MMECPCRAGLLQLGAPREGKSVAAFYLVIIRQTAVWCADVTEVEKALAEYFGEATSWRMDGKVLVLQAAGGDMRLGPAAQH